MHGTNQSRRKQEKDALRLLFANQNWWSKGCLSAKILTSTKNEVDEYKVQAKHSYQTVVPTSLLSWSSLLQRSKLPNKLEKSFNEYIALFIKKLLKTKI